MTEPINPGATAKAGVAQRIGQLTAVIVALTSLVGAIVALVVAVQSGADQILPTFERFFRKAADPKPPAACAPQAPALAQALSGLDGDGRREARVALAVALARECPQRVDALIAGLPKASYRRQVGVAVALAQTAGGWPSDNSPASVTVLRQLARETDDKTLKSWLERAAENPRAG